MEQELQRAFFKWWRCPPLDDSGVCNIQETFLDSTIRSPLYKSSPIPASKARNFVKRLILSLEDSGQEVLTELYDFVLSPEVPEGRCRTYWPTGLAGCGEPLSLLEDGNLISCGTTGLRTWPAALALSEYLLSHHGDLLEGKDILELGSGAGYLGLSLGACGLPSSVTLTDCHPEVLNILRENNARNGSNALVERLEWSQPHDEDSSRKTHQLIVASDVVFDPSILKDLLGTLSALLDEKGHAFIACTVRNEETLSAFEEEARIHFHSEVVSTLSNPDHRVDEGDPILPIRIYKLIRT